MKIREYKCQVFSEIEKGQVFANFAGGIYIKTVSIFDKDGNCYNSVFLPNGGLCFFEDSEKIYSYPNAELTL